MLATRCLTSAVDDLAAAGGVPEGIAADQLDSERLRVEALAREIAGLGG